MKNSLLLFICVSIFHVTTQAQNSFTLYAVPSVAISTPISKRWSQTFALENRNYAYRNNDFNLKLKHIEPAYFIKYKIDATKKIGLGSSYRIESSKAKEREFRLMQQYEWKAKPDAKLKNRLRTEQRIYSSHTNFRVRYQSALSVPVKKVVDVINLSEELLAEAGKTIKPEYENRITLSVGWKLSEKSSFNVGTQYRLSDFTHQPSHNLFANFGLSIDL